MRIAIVIPCFKVRRHIVGVINELLGRVEKVIVVDDRCPENTGALVEHTFVDEPAVQVLFHQENQGVGAAVVTGYRAALSAGFDVCVKIDGDGQMDPGYLTVLLDPILSGKADYTKGNRFWRIEDLQKMPRKRLFGNAVLSFVNKVSSGYWTIMDPTNGYTAIHRTALKLIDLDKLAKRYFFESDMLFRLNIVRAVVADVPMPSIYGDETSNLHISKIILDFQKRYITNTFKRLFYNYILRDLNSATIEGLIGALLLVVAIPDGLIVSLHAWETREPTATGTIVLVALMLIVGTQFLLAALNYDIHNVPTVPLQTISALQIEVTPLRGSGCSATSVALPGEID